MKLFSALLYYAGLHLSEARNLKWQDVNFERKIVHIKHAKGEKDPVNLLLVK